MRIGPGELIVVLLVVLVIFGAGKLPEVGASLGKGIRSFKKGLAGEDQEAGPESPPRKPV